MKRIGYYLSLIIFFAAAASFGGTLRLEDGRVWLETRRASLADVLQQFDDCGVEVFVDPELSGTPVSGQWENVAAESLMKELVSPHSYVLRWQRIYGPLGPLKKLSSIHVFSDGNRSAAKPLSAKRKVLDLVTGTNGVKYVRGEILIGFEEGTDADDLKVLARRLGGSVIEAINPPGVYRLRLGDDISVEDAVALAKETEGVAVAEPNLAYSKIGSTPSSNTELSGNPNLHLAPGEIGVAVMDSGLDPQYADLPFIRGMYNALNPKEPMSDPTGHGTLVAMVASGAVTPLGAEPSDSGVPVLAIRTFDENGYTSSDTVMRALNYAKAANITIVNMSWGSETDSAFMQAAVNYAARHGIQLYAAAGNEPTGTPIYPAGYPEVTAIGGLNADGGQWSQSNYGDFVDRYLPAFAPFKGRMFQGTSISSPYACYLRAIKK